MSRIAEALQRVNEHSAEAVVPAEASSRADAPGVAAEEALPSIARRRNRPTSGRVSTGAAPGELVAGQDPLMAVFHGFAPGVAGKLVTSPDAPPGVIEQYRRLAATLHHAQAERGINVVMLASAIPAEGKTLTATNLALTFSESYRRRVLLIDADLRRPTMHQIFQVPNVSGLNDGLKSETEQGLSLIQVSRCLTLLTAGRPDPDPMSGLTSERMRRLIQEAAARFDWVFIDTPPVGLLPDANLLAAMVDVAILVIRAGKSPYRLVQRAADAVGRNRIIGVVLNAMEEGGDVGSQDYYYSNYYYGHRDRSRGRASAAR